jgi:hypothetical protein
MFNDKVNVFRPGKTGSAQESDEGCILGGFLENDDFSPPGRPNIRFRRKWAEFAPCCGNGAPRAVRRNN